VKNRGYAFPHLILVRSRDERHRPAAAIGTHDGTKCAIAIKSSMQSDHAPVHDENPDNRFVAAEQTRPATRHFRFESAQCETSETRVTCSDLKTKTTRNVSQMTKSISPLGSRGPKLYRIEDILFTEPEISIVSSVSTINSSEGEAIAVGGENLPFDVSMVRTFNL
jgi:hypothetical protein